VRPTGCTVTPLPCCSDFLAFKNVAVFKQDSARQVPLSMLLG
jgi:hypothetical protein